MMQQQEFDPRRPAFRIAPRMLMGLAGCCALMLGWKLTAAEAHLPSAGLLALDHQRLETLQHKAFAEGEAQPGLALAQNVDVEVQGGETMESAIRRVGVSPDEAKAAVAMLSGVMDTIHIRQGLGFKAAVAKTRDERGSTRLIGLSMRTSPSSVITISRTFDGALKMRELNEKVLEETTVAQGDIEGSFYETAAEQGATDSLTNQAAKLFSHKIDFSRDIRDGDTFKMVFTRKVTESGHTVEAGDLLYAEVDAGKAGDKPMRFYRFQEAGSGEAQYFDEFGKNIKGFLLATPLAVMRVTSTFGMRHHPVLGYDKMHQGIDFAGGTGTPIFAAGDGTVKEAGKKGGYGNWIEIKHDGVWSTGYAHMSRYAPGMRPGVHVNQGQIIGYVGATGRVTGPHLHFEVMENGVKINPKGAKVPSGKILTGGELIAFNAQKAKVDKAIQVAQAGGQTRMALADSAAPKTDQVSLRPTQVALRR
jgi:murein DD-endopeptidase MepM/ murein hydrolase activator NlpD